ncbi:hypothetical protein GQX74_001461 [Glossina fuscipes]|nr:hypothetical protein GQX74_001461 [Glossina fuscipes]
MQRQTFAVLTEDEQFSHLYSEILSIVMILKLLVVHVIQNKKAAKVLESFGPFLVKSKPYFIKWCNVCACNCAIYQFNVVIDDCAAQKNSYKVSQHGSDKLIVNKYVKVQAYKCTRK